MEKHDIKKFVESYLLLGNYSREDIEVEYLELRCLTEPELDIKLGHGVLLSRYKKGKKNPRWFHAKKKIKAFKNRPIREYIRQLSEKGYLDVKIQKNKYQNIELLSLNEKYFVDNWRSEVSFGIPQPRLSEYETEISSFYKLILSFDDIRKNIFSFIVLKNYTLISKNGFEKSLFKNYGHAMLSVPLSTYEIFSRYILSIFYLGHFTATSYDVSDKFITDEIGDLLDDVYSEVSHILDQQSVMDPFICLFSYMSYKRPKLRKALEDYYGLWSPTDLI